MVADRHHPDRSDGRRRDVDRRVCGVCPCGRGAVPRPALAHADCSPGTGTRPVLGAREVPRARELRRMPPDAAQGLERELARPEHGARCRGPARGDEADGSRDGPALPACHAPLAEQQPDIGPSAEFVPNPALDDALLRQGSSAPPVTSGSTNGSARPADRVRKDDREARIPAARRRDSPLGVPAIGFRSPRHQFPGEGFALNGKPLENTYEEWRASPAARRGLEWQDCHMPDRRHLWRGIHERHRPGDEARATVRERALGPAAAGESFARPRPS
jgi:hypothetical protein